jgi:single-strand selective monofunctional uracil DNA glycosylase
MSLVEIARRLCREVSPLRFGHPVHHVYNPLDYAWAPHREYLERYGAGRHGVLVVGMNPGYFGMAQTGVPFGDVEMVRDWLAIHSDVQTPAVEHPARPIAGFACKRREVSGQRLWGWAREAFATPERFFAQFFVLNYCPLCFLAQSGANIPADCLLARDRDVLFASCNRALRSTAQALGARYAIGIGRFAERHVAAVLGDIARCGGAPHPSPANPAASRDWGAAMNRALAELGVELPR